MKKLRALLYPVSIIYGLIMLIRNKLYDFGILKSTEFSSLVISVGNLSTGGTGKTPLTEYIIRLLKDKARIGVLSRGYGRKTSGFILADPNPDPDKIGDEPAQIKNKFPDLIVSVCENRVKGIEYLQKIFADIKTIILDDAFQHRSVKPGLNIVLVDYNNLYQKKTVLPAGDYREFFGGIKRADIIIITKIPVPLNPVERRQIIRDFEPEAYQKLLFSHLDYEDIVSADGSLKYTIEDLKQKQVLLITGIADPEPLKDFLKHNNIQFKSVDFNDHHAYSKPDLEKIKKYYQEIQSENKIILTTEKDMVKFRQTDLDLQSWFYLPVRMKFYGNDGEEFDQKLLYMLNNKI